VSIYFEMRIIYSEGVHGMVSAKWRVTIPKHVRDALRLQPDDVIDFTVQGDQIIVSKRRAPCDLGPFVGIFAAGRETDQVMRDLRPVRAWDEVGSFG